MNIQNWFRRMMTGRYGIDKLGYVLIGGSLVLIFLQGFLRWDLLYLAALALLALGYYRFFSRNIPKRRNENDKFLRWWAPIGAMLAGKGREVSELRDYHHFKCPSCGQKVRVPKGRGRVCISCPKCNTDFIKKT